ncbi:negative elongation factor A [Caerostris extrusa]|uniref:Negative elongation factor A n=1 Tax=Caerostris extrusa TaxID=172846 RepID=A0AAV4THI2_CAEEX|nr:negative elongation factor A [Caerostris extrusa]
MIRVEYMEILRIKHSAQPMLSMECMYLNRTALTSVVGQPPQPIKHFTLKQKPKSATLRAELLQKSQDATTTSKKNSTTPSVPIRCVSNELNRLQIPFKPSRTPKLHPQTGRVQPRTPAGRKDGGIKLLEIDEQPLGFGRDAKRRKKNPGMT